MNDFTDHAAARQATQKAAFETNKLSKRLHRLVGQAITDFRMIEEGDKVMVCLSGGKDSYAMLDLLLSLRRRAPIHFDIVAVNLDQKQPGFPEHVLPQYLKSLQVPFHIEEQDTYSIVKRLIPTGQTMCSLCSRLRRGILYRVASELGATKIALGHHRDDIVVTLLMNMFFGSRMKGMPAKLVSDDGRHVVIRPLAYVAEGDLVRWAQHKQFPIIPCTLCGSQDNLQRVQVKKMINEWERQYPGRIENMLTAMGNVVPSHLMDRQLYPFTTIKATGVADPAGDRAFDDDEGCTTPAAPGSSAAPADAAPTAVAADSGLASAAELAAVSGVKPIHWMPGTRPVATNSPAQTSSSHGTTRAALDEDRPRAHAAAPASAGGPLLEN